MCHELNWLSPPFVDESHDREPVALGGTPVDGRSEPLRWARGHLPADALTLGGLDNLYVEAILAETELDRSADCRITGRVSRPPPREAVKGGDGGVSAE
jgi:hypothetical protein